MLKQNEQLVFKALGLPGQGIHVFIPPHDMFRVEAPR